MNVLLFGSVPRGARGTLGSAARRALGPHLRRRGELCVVFVRDREIRRINREFLGHDRPTDVIAFRHETLRGGSAASKEAPPFGDVFIGLDAAERQARGLGHGLTRELATLVVHGILHLRGYDDRRLADRRRMSARQKRLVDSLLGRR